MKIPRTRVSNPALKRSYLWKCHPIGSGPQPSKTTSIACSKSIHLTTAFRVLGTISADSLTWPFQVLSKIKGSLSSTRTKRSSPKQSMPRPIPEQKSLASALSSCTPVVERTSRGHGRRHIRISITVLSSRTSSTFPVCPLISCVILELQRTKNSSLRSSSWTRCRQPTPAIRIPSTLQAIILPGGWDPKPFQDCTFQG